jgi:hypothetical protein
MTTFPLSTLLDLGLTDAVLQEQLANVATDMDLEVNGDITTIWMFQVNLRIEIKDSKIVKLFNFKKNAEIWAAAQQEDLIADIHELEVKKQGKCLLITVAYDKQIQGFSARLVAMGEFLEYVVTGGLK